MIRFTCPTCKKSLTAGDGQEGVRILCSNCKQRVPVPVRPGRMKPPYNLDRKGAK